MQNQSRCGDFHFNNKTSWFSIKDFKTQRSFCRAPGLRCCITVQRLVFPAASLPAVGVMFHMRDGLRNIHEDATESDPPPSQLCLRLWFTEIPEPLTCAGLTAQVGGIQQFSHFATGVSFAFSCVSVKRLSH